MTNKLSRRERRALMKNKSKKNNVKPQVETWSKDRDTFKVLKDIYEKKYKLLLLIPLILLIASISVIVWQYETTGDFVKKGISLKGGIQVTVTRDMANIDSIDLVELEKKMDDSFKNYDINVQELTDFGKRSGIVFQAGFEDKFLINQFLEKIHEFIPETNIKELENLLSTMGSSLSNDFFRTALIAVFVAFLFMAFVVFLSFKTFAPSLAVVMAALSDIITTLAIVDLLGIELSTAGVAAFLMLIGYSVDTDILLSTRVIKRKSGTIMERIYSSMKTGLGMTITTLGAVTIGLFFATSNELKQIFTIILIGLLIDIINTWIQNVGILRWYLEKRGVRK